MKTIKHSFLQNLISGALFAAVLGVTNPAYAYAPQNPQLGAISYAATYTNNGAFTLPGGNTTFYFDVHWMALDDYATVLLSGPINIAVYNSVGTQVASLQQVAGQLINPPTLTQPTCAPGTASTTWTGSQMESWGKVQWTLNLPSGNYTYTVLTYKTYIVGYNATTTCNFCSGFPFYGSGGSAVAQGLKFNSIPDQWAGATVTLNGSGLDQPYYRSTYSDLNTAFGSNVNQYWSHWQGSGYTEGRSPYAGSTAAGAACAQSGMPVAFTVASGPASLSGNTLTFTGAGKVVIAANAPGGVATNGAIFKPASASVTFNVNAMYRIGAQNPIDTFRWGSNRFYGFNPALAPGNSRTATFNLTAPATAGSYNFQTKIVADGVEWFGDPSTNAVIQVANLPTATIKAVSASINMGQSSTITATFGNDAADGDNLTSSYINVVSPSGTESWLTGASSITWTPSTPGTYTFKAYMATTLTQPAKSFASCTVNVTNTPPTGTISTTATSIPVGGVVTLSVTGTDIDNNLDGLNIDGNGGYMKIDGGPYTFNGTMPNNGSMSFAQCGTKTQTCLITFTTAGTYNFMASTHDPIAGWTYSAPITIKVSNSPTATITANPSSIATGFSSTITANYTTDTANGDSIADTDIDIAGPNGYYTSQNGGGANPFSITLTPTTPGTYTCYAYLCTAIRGWAWYKTCTVTVVNNPPVITGIGLTSISTTSGSHTTSPTAINYWVSATDIDNNLDSIYTMVRPSGGNANSFNIDWTTADYPSCDQQSGFAKTGSQTSSFSLPIRLNSKAWPIMGYYWFGPIALDVPDWNSGDTWTGSPSLTVLVSTPQSVSITSIPNQTINNTITLSGGGLDQTYYRNNNGDLNTAFGSDVQDYWNHFQNYGYYEGRAPNSGVGVPGSAYASSGLPVTFTVSGPATISGNTLSFTGLGTVTLTATQAGGGTISDAYFDSKSASTTFTVVNSSPTVAVTINSSTFNAGARTSGPVISLNFGQSATVTITAADADGNGTNSYFIHDNGNNTQWSAAPAGSTWTTDTAPWSAISGSNYSSSGTFIATFTPQFVPSAQTFYRVGGYAYDSAGGKTGNYGSVTVNKATPSGTFANQTFVYGTTLTAGMLSATFSNQDSVTVTQPTGAKTYTVIAIISNPGAATPVLTVLTVGSSLNAGTYTIAATCAADGNYNLGTATATFTVTPAPIATTPTISASPNPVNSGHTTVISPANGTTGNYSWTLNGTVISNGPGGVWAPASGTYANGTWSISGNQLLVVPNTTATSFTTAFTDTGDSNRSAKTSSTLTVTVIVNSPPVVTFDGIAGDGTMPNAGYVSSTMNFWGTASDPDGNLSRVDVYVDGTVRGQATISGGNWTFNKTAASMSLGIGSHTTQAIAYDSLGASTSSGTPSFTINNRAPGVPTATVTSIDYGARTITVQVTGTDPDANLDMFFLQVRGPNTDTSINWSVDLGQSQSFSLTGSKTVNFTVPFAGGPSGSGTGTYWFGPIGLDQPDWGTITYGTAITAVVDRDPAVAFSASPTSINFGQTTTLTSTATDPDGVLNFQGILALKQDGSAWLQPVGVDYSNGSVNGTAWGNFTTTTDFVSASFTNGVVSGASHTETAVHRPSFVGQVTYHSNANDGIDWESSNAPAAYAYVTVNKSSANPNGFSNQTFNYGTLLTAGMLNAAWVNPYTTLVTPPPPSATYNASGYGAVAVGTKLPPGVYTVKATYSGDNNYQSGTTQSATFTVNPNPLLGSFDSGLNTARNHDYFFMNGDAAQINGWAYSPDSTSPGTPKFYIDGALISTLSTIPGARPDIAALGPNAIDSGFSTPVTLSGLSIGTHTFSVNASNAWTTSTLLPYATGGNTGTFTICPPTASQTVTFLAGGSPISDGGTFYYGQTLTMTNTGSAPAGYISENDVGWRFNGGAYSYSTGTTFDGGVTWQVFTGAAAATTSSTRTVTLTPPSGFGTYGLLAEIFTGFPANTRPLGGSGSQAGSYPSFTYAKATPVGTFANRTLTPAVAGSPFYTVALGDLNATFANPYTGSVTQPTGTPIYTIAPSSPTGTAGTVISAGSTPNSGSTYVIRATYQGDSLYNSGAIVDSTWTINKANQAAVSINSAATATYGTTYTATATGGNGGGVIVWGLGAGSTASGAAIDGATGIITAKSTGTVVINAYRASDANYNQSATTSNFTVTVGARPITITLSGSKAYDTTTAATGASANITTGSLALGDTIANAIGVLSSANAGIYMVNVGLTVTPTISNGVAPVTRTTSYTITYAGSYTVNQATQPSVNITSAATIIYGNPYTATATGGTGSGALVWTLNAGASTAAGAAIDSASGVVTANSTGTVVFTAYRAADTNYLPSATTANFTLTVTPRPITVTLAGSKTYDGTTASTGASASISSGALAPGDSIGYAYGALPSANVATYLVTSGLTVTPTVSNATAPLTRTSNYTVTYAGSYQVTQAAQPAVSVTSANSVTYGTAYIATATGGAGSGSLVWALNAGLSTAAGAAINPVNGMVTYNSTGTLVFTVYRGGDTNYLQSATTANFTVTVNACPITITLTGSDTYDGTTSSSGALANISSGSLAVGDVIGYAYGVLSSPVAGTYPILTGLPVIPTITNSMAPLSRTSNYAITYAGNFVVNPKPITITLSGSKPYDTNTVATGASASVSSGSLAASDSIGYAYGPLSSANVGTYPVTTGLVVTPTITSGTAPLTRTGSYTITYAGSFSVTKGTQSAVTINSAATVPYGTSYTATATGGNGGGALSWALGSGSTVPGAAIDPATGVVTANSSGTVVFNVTRAGDTNYNPSATTANFTLTVNPQPITITLSGSKPYDTNTVATGASASITSGSLVAGDSIAYAYGALSSANANTYPVTTGLVVTPTVTSAVVPFTRTSSYTVTYAGSFTVTKINQPAVSITSAASTTYGTPYTATATGGAGGGALTWALGVGSTASGAAIDSATGVVTANSTGTVVFNVYRAMDTNYNQSATTGNFTVTFTPRLITVTLSGSKPYDGTTASTGASATITSGTLGTGDSIGFAYGALSSPLAGVYSVTTGLPVTPTISNATAPLSRASNYTITYAGSFTVNPIAITITLAGSKPYDTTTVATGASASITSGSLGTGDSIAYAYGALSGSIVGTYPVTTGLVLTPTVTSGTAPFTRIGSYTITYAGSFSVNKGPQAAVTITSAATATYGTPYTATATGGTGGGFLSWALGVGSTASGAAIDSVSGTITANSTGTVVINAFRGGDSNYLPSATTADFTVTVGARPITVTLAGSKTYDATTVATGASATMTSGTLAPGDSIGYAYSALPSANAATYLVTTGLVVTPTITSGTAPLTRTSNYAITYAGNYTVNKADQTSVTITSASTITYGTPYTATATGGAGSGALVWTINAVASTSAGAAIDPVTGVITANSTGQVVFTAYRAADTNYNQSATTANFTVIINNRPITVTLAGSKNYDTTTVATGASASISSGTLAPGDSIGFAYGALPSANVATYPASTGLTVTPTVCNATAPLTRTSNYTVTYAGSYQVTQAPEPAVSITSANSVTYGTAYTATATGGAGSGFLTWALNAGLSTAAGAAINPVNGMVTYNSTGTLVFTVYRGGDSNYLQSATTANFTVTINACPITVTLAGSKTYDGMTASTGASASITSGSLAVGDAISYALGVLSSPVAGTYPITTGLPVTPTITNSMAPLSRTSNYAITYAGNFIVSPKPITISLAGSKPYDTTTVATGASASISSGTLIAGDSIGYAYGPLSSAIVGTYLPTTGLVVTPTVTNATAPITRTGSYTFTFAGSYTVNKGTQAALTITSANGFNYGDAYTATATGGSGGGVIQWALGFGSTANSASIGLISGSVGACSAGTVVINAYRLGDSNYNQSAPTADFTVTVAARPITVTLAGSKVYDTTTASAGASASVTTGTLAAGDTIAFAYGSLSSANGGIYPVTTGLVVTPTVSNLTAPMTRTGAYVITYAGSFSVTQGTQAPVSITSAHTAVFGSGYAATASGGSGSGVYSWSLGTGSTALAASINSSTGAIQSTGLGTIVIKVQRVADTNYSASAWSADFSITLTSPPPAILLSVASQNTIWPGDTITLNITASQAVGNVTYFTWRLVTPSGTTGWSQVNGPTATLVGSAPYSPTVLGAYEIQVNAYNDAGGSTYSSYDFNVIQGVFSRSVAIRAEPAPAMGIWFTTSPGNTQSITVNKTR